MIVFLVDVLIVFQYTCVRRGRARGAEHRSREQALRDKNVRRRLQYGLPIVVMLSPSLFPLHLPAPSEDLNAPHKGPRRGSAGTLDYDSGSSLNSAPRGPRPRGGWRSSNLMESAAQRVEVESPAGVAAETAGIWVSACAAERL